MQSRSNYSSFTRRQFLAMTAMTGATGAMGLFGPFVPVAQSTDGKKLKVRFYGSISSFDPGYNVGGSPDYDVMWAVMPSLVHFGYKEGTLTYRPSAYVKKIEQRDDTHIDFTLKPGFMWTNGFGELTAEDVKFSYERMKTSDWKGYFDALDKVEIHDKYSGTLVLKQPFAPFMVATLAAGTGTILSKKATESVGGKFTTEIPATCGPYLYEWRQKQWVKFKSNPQWTGPKPAYDEIHAVFITEDMAAALAYEAGEVDMTKIVPNTYKRYLKKLPPDSKLLIAGKLQNMWLGMNTEHPKLKDIRVRKAIQRAVDAASVNEGAYDGTLERQYGFVCPGLLGKRNESKYSYDPAEARRLLKDAGVSGLELSIRTLNNQERVLAAQIIQANLKSVGIKASVLPLDAGPYWEMGMEDKGDTWKDLELYIMRWGAGADPYEPFQWLRRDQIGKWNWERWSDDEYEEIYEKSLAESDPAKREKFYLRMQEIIEDTGAYVWLGHEPEVYVHRTSLIPAVAPSGEMILRYFQSA
jgi:peptide/nickel transport system substrate-binding protein